MQASCDLSALAKEETYRTSFKIRTRKAGRKECVEGEKGCTLMGTACPKGRWVVGSKNNQGVTKPSFSLKYSHFMDIWKVLILLVP